MTYAIINTKSRFEKHHGKTVLILRRADRNKAWVKLDDGRELVYSLNWLTPVSIKRAKYDKNADITRI